MGGLGSGRWPGESTSKETTEDYFALDIRAIKRHGLIVTDQEEITGVARLAWIPAGFGVDGGFLRPWFLCPRSGCTRRVAILYGRIGPGSHPGWACRTCLDLCYPVEREGHAKRAIRKMLKARAKLGPGDTKPKRMHHKTFARLVREYLQAVEVVQAAQQEQLSSMVEQMERERIELDL